MNIFTEPDFDVVQTLYGFILLAGAIVAATNPTLPIVTGMVCLLLIKDGLPNFIVGGMGVARKGGKK